MENLFLKILNMSLTGSYVILAVLVARLLLQRFPKKYSFALWSVAAFRLVCPVSIRSVFSIFSLLPERSAQAASSVGSAITYIPSDIGYAAVPEVNMGIPAISDAVNHILPAATPTASVNPIQIWIFLGTVIWCVGIAVMIGWALVSLLLLRKRVEKATIREKGLYECDTVRSPFILGFLSPKIYIPYGLEEEHLRYILAHERFHVKKMDHIARFAAYLILALHWFNPLCWLGYYLMGKDMEMRCDEHVLSRSGTLSWEYSYSLLSVATNRRFSPAGPLAFRESSVKTRIKNILHWKKPKIWISVLAIVLCLGCVVVCVTNPAAADSEQKSFVTDEIIYLSKRSTESANDDGYRYFLNEDSIVRIQRKTEKIDFEVVFDRVWEAFPYDKETWNTMINWATFNQGMTVDFIMEGSAVSYRHINEEYFLLYLEGTMYICRQEMKSDGKPIILTIFSLKPETDSNVLGNGENQYPQNKDHLPVMKYQRIPVDDIFWWRKSYKGSFSEWFYNQTHTVDEIYDDPKLQRYAAWIPVEYPLDSRRKVDDYAWALYDYFMEEQAFDPALVPTWADHYAEGIWEILFSPHFDVDGHVYYDGDTAKVLISEADGHIIYFTTEENFMKPSYHSRREENHYEWEPWESLQYIWCSSKESKDIRGKALNFALNDRYDNEKVQEKMASVFAEYPLESQNDVQSYAWGLYDALKEENLVSADKYPIHANYYHDGVWDFTFANPYVEGKAVRVFVSAEDGEVIYIHVSSPK